MPSFSVITNNIPNGKPKANENIVENTIYNVLSMKEYYLAIISPPRLRFVHLEIYGFCISLSFPDNSSIKCPTLVLTRLFIFDNILASISNCLTFDTMVF